MKYAQDNHFGNSETARAEKTKRASRTARRIYAWDAEAKRCGPGAERQTQGSSCGNASDGFLKVSFLPILHQDKAVQDSGKTAEMQDGFYSSLDRLALHYSIAPMQSRHFGYPLNIALALWDLEEKLKKSAGNFSDLLAVQNSGRTYLTCGEKYSTGTTLYYIPVAPVYQMLKDPRSRPNALLLLSVFSYLYHSADVPYYREQGSYLYWLYEMHREWTEQDEDREGDERCLREFDKAEVIGDYMEKKVFSPMNLEVFEKRLNAFKIYDGFDSQCFDIARKAFGLFSEYPQQSIFRNAPTADGDEEEDTENESIAMEKYISFIWDTKGWLYESMEQSINSEFNEYGSMDEPAVVKRFDGDELQSSSLDFENRLFALLDGLCEMLHNYKKNENEQRN